MEDPGALIWVYGLLRKGEERIPSVPDIEGTHHYTFVATSELAALVSLVPIQEYGEPVLQQNIDNNEWLLPRIVAFANIIANTFEHAPLMPWRFGTVFSSKERLRNLLQANETALVETLEKLRGTEEWGLKIFGHIDNRVEELVKEQLQMSRDISPGRLHFLRRKLRSSTQEQAKAELKDIAAVIYQQVESRGYPSQVSERSENERLPTGELLTLKAAYLVPRHGRDGFLALIDDIRTTYADHHTALLLTGPWAPYSFCHAAIPDLHGVS